MLINPASAWLALLPPPTSTAPDSVYAGGRPLPNASCNIESLRETFLPCLPNQHRYSGRPHTGAAVVTTGSTRDVDALIRLHVSRFLRVTRSRRANLRTLLQTSTLPLPFNPAFFLSVILKDGFITLVAKIGPALVGSLTAFVDVARSGKGQLHILTLCVDPTVQRQGMSNEVRALTSSLTRAFRPGIALAMLSELSDRLVRLPVAPREALLHVQVTNAAAVQLYKRIGFHVARTESGYYRGAVSGGTAAYEMRKTL